MPIPTNRQPTRHPDVSHPDRDDDHAPWHRLRWPTRLPDDDPDEDDDLGTHPTSPEWPWDPDD